MRKSLPLVLAILLTGATFACKDPSKSVPAASVENVEAPAEAPAEDAKPSDAPTVTETIALNSENTTVEFEGSKVTGSHTGGFRNIEGSIVVSDQLPTTTASVTVQTASIFSDDEKLTEHLQSDDFFSVETYPTASFNVTSISEAPNADGTHQVHAVLTMRGVDRPIAFPAKIEVTDAKVNVDAEFSINRREWGIVYDGQKDNLIRDGVVLRLKVNADRAAR